MFKAKLVQYIVIELSSRGDLFDLLTVKKTGFSEKVARHLFKQILKGLDHSHSQGFTHRDLKLENILVDEHFRLKLTDFGFAAPMQGRDQSGFLKTRIGTLGYRAPEIRTTKEGYLGKNADVFSAGVILFFLVCMNNPFREASKIDNLYRCIINKRYELFWKWHMKLMAKASGIELVDG